MYYTATVSVKVSAALIETYGANPIQDLVLALVSADLDGPGDLSAAWTLKSVKHEDDYSAVIVEGIIHCPEVATEQLVIGMMESELLARAEGFESITDNEFEDFIRRSFSIDEIKLHTERENLIRYAMGRYELRHVLVEDGCIRTAEAGKQGLFYGLYVRNDDDLSDWILDEPDFGEAVRLLREYADADQANTELHWVCADSAFDMMGPYLANQAGCPICKARNEFRYIESYASPVECIVGCEHLRMREFRDDGNNWYGFSPA